MANLSIVSKSTSTLSDVSPEIAEALILQGDISRLTPAQKTEYAVTLCQKLGLEPLTKPFQVLKFQGKEQLYPLKGATDQLRKQHKISLSVDRTWLENGLYFCQVTGTTPDGRTDSDVGFAIAGGIGEDGKEFLFRGEALGNALLKAVTKAKRRVTLAMCGLSMLAPEEVQDMPGAMTAEIIYPEPKTLAQADSDRKERIALATEVKQQRELAGWSQEDYITYCDTEFGKHPTQLSLPELEQSLALLSGLNKNTINLETDQ